MKGSKLRTPIMLVMLLLIIGGISTQPEWVEKYYSQGVYPYIAGLLSGISSLFPFALGEVVILAGFIVIVIVTFRFILKKRKNRSMMFIDSHNSIFKVRSIVSLILMVLVAFQVLWGLNYSRLPLKHSLGVEVYPRESRELYQALLWHIEKANVISSGFSREDYQTKYDVWTGYENLPDEFKLLSQVKGRAKGLVSSTFFSYAGIAGIYNPFLAEPNINRLQVDYMHPVVSAHELAHLQGIAREDEANFTAVMVCLSHEKEFVQYSGHMLAVIHMLNALYTVDQDLWEEAVNHISDQVRLDLNRNSAFWDAYDGWFEEASSDLNDAYLKANGLEDGVKSYGRMVDLLLATMDIYGEMN